MSIKLRVVVAKKLFRPVYDGTGGNDGGGEGQGQTPPAQQSQGQPPSEKTFTQKELDDIINKRFGKEKSEKEKLVSELKTLKESKGLTEQEKEQLATRIEDMEKSMLTKEQVAAQERANLEKKHANEVKKFQSESENWRTLFVDSTMTREITDAAVSAGAEFPDQLVMMFKGASRLDTVKDDTGKEIPGRYQTRVKFTGKNEEGEMQDFDLPVHEAFSKMREQKLHANLWKHQATPGTGQGAGSGQGKGGDPSQMPDRDNFKNDADWRVAYDSWRDNYNLDGSPIKKK